MNIDRGECKNLGRFMTAILATLKGACVLAGELDAADCREVFTAVAIEVERARGVARRAGKNVEQQLKRGPLFQPAALVKLASMWLEGQKTQAQASDTERLAACALFATLIRAAIVDGDDVPPVAAAVLIENAILCADIERDESRKKSERQIAAFCWGIFRTGFEQMTPAALKN